MASDHELQIVAQVVGIVREDWVPRSVLAMLRREPSLRDRPYRWLAVAAVIVALDPASKTPKRLLEFGPWWQAAAVSTGEGTDTPGPGKEPACERVGHEHELARNCRACRAQALAETEVDAAPLEPAPPPAAITEVAERHRRLTPRSDRRDFAQTEELRQVDGFNVTRCQRCQGVYVDTADGSEAHRTVFGHEPQPEPCERVSAAVDAEADR